MPKNFWWWWGLTLLGALFLLTLLLVPSPREWTPRRPRWLHGHKFQEDDHES
jgi:hypothetical protein